MRKTATIARRRLRGLALCWLCALLAAPAGANDLDRFGFGARAIALGGAVSALATEFDATYYNPGGLALAPESAAAAGFSYAGYALRYRSSALDRRQERHVERQQPLSALTLGFNVRFGDEGWAGRSAVGLGLFLPTRQIVGTELETGPGNPQFFLYGARRDKIGLTPAFALRILPWEGGDGPRLALGFGATVLADLRGRLVFDLSSGAQTPVRTELDLKPDAAPNVGLFLALGPRLSMGLTYRGELSLKAELPVVIDLDGDGASDFPLDLEAITLFQPRQLAFGIAWDPHPALTISTDLVWQNWSAFRDPFITVRPVIGQTDPHFDDVFVSRLGIEWRATDALALRLGYAFEPSPIPAQRDETTLLDNDVHVLSFGLGWTWWRTRERLWRERGPEGEPGAIRAEPRETRPLSIDLFAQWHHLATQRVNKRSGERFESGGDVWNGGIQLTVRF